jgi:hypothetical protein
MKAQKNLNTKTTKQNNRRLTGSLPGWVLTLCIFFLPNLTQAQLTYSHWLQFRQFTAFAVQNPGLPNLIYNNPAWGGTNYVRRFETGSVAAFSSLSKTPRYAEFNELGWFCTLDLKMDLKMKLPLRFRLGSLEEVNRKEGY